MQLELFYSISDTITKANNSNGCESYFMLGYTFILMSNQLFAVQKITRRKRKDQIISRIKLGCDCAFRTTYTRTLILKL